MCVNNEIKDLEKFKKTQEKAGYVKKSEPESNGPKNPPPSIPKVFRMPKPSFSKKSKNFKVPLGMQINYGGGVNDSSEESSEDTSSEDDSVKIMERDRLEIERIRKKRMQEKGLRYYYKPV